MRTLLVSFALLLTACGGATSSSSSQTGPGGTSSSGTTTTVTDTSPVCGTRGASPCPEGEFCDFPEGSECGATDRGGRCVPRPQACTREFAPVCGCDGQTHPTACVPPASGVSVARVGECGE